MEPAVKPAAQASRSRSVGVLATPATFQGKLFASVVERFAQGVELIEVVLPGLVEQIEAGQLESPATRRILQQGLAPLRSRGVDTLVLACTHYPFVIPQIRQLAGDGVEVIDPAPAIARQTGRLLAEVGPADPNGPAGHVTLYSTGDAPALARMAGELIQLRAESRSMSWRGLELLAD
jgi:glutamate racemase